MEKYKSGFGSQVSAPRPGDMCCCLFDADGCFYRGKVLKRLADGQFEILYVDFGNTESVPASYMRSIDPSLAALPPMATAYKPSFIKLPRESSDALDAVAELSSLVRFARAVFASRSDAVQVMNRPLLVIPAHRHLPQLTSPPSAPAHVFFHTPPAVTRAAETSLAPPRRWCTRVMPPASGTLSRGIWLLLASLASTKGARARPCLPRQRPRTTRCWRRRRWLTATKWAYGATAIVATAMRTSRVLLPTRGAKKSRAERVASSRASRR